MFFLQVLNKANKLKILKRYFVPVNFIYILWLLALIFVVVGPVWIVNKKYTETEYYSQTMLNFNKKDFLKGKGELYVGFAESEIEVEAGQPIMGYTDRKTLDSKGSVTPCYSKAISVKVGDATVSIVGVDVMLLMGDIINDVYTETGLSRDEIFFTSTHTHSGVGGWFAHPLFELFYGKYSKKYYDHLKDSIVSAILQSRKGLVKAKVKFTKVDAREWLEDRVYKVNPAKQNSGFHDVNPYFTGIAFVDYNNDNDIIALLTSYAAHATVIRKDVIKFSSDYPGKVCEELKKLTGAKGVLFAAGSVGDARSTVLHQKGVNFLGSSLAKKLYPAITKTKSVQVNSLESMCLPIKMPKARFSLLGPHTGMLPILASWLFDRPIHMSYLQIGEFAIIGMPVDIAGELTKEYEDEYPVLFTSFNGSWKGYATKEDTYLNRNTYSTREMGVAGAQAGQYLMDLADKIYLRNNN